MILESALLCLALNVYHESRGQPEAVQQAVAQVTMNRAEQDQKKVCEVVFKPQQFSWANNLKKVDRNPRAVIKRRNLNGDNKEWKESLVVARQALLGEFKSRIKDATHFYHAKTDNPRWKRRFIYIARIGPFIFMKA